VIRLGAVAAGLSVRKVAIGLGFAVVLPLAMATGPLTAPLPDGVELRDMTWVEVRAALASGQTTVIVPTGGIEQNGPHMILGKHDDIVREAARRIAKSVGQTLVAPVVSYVPEGDYEPPSGHMRFPGTLGVPEPVFAGVLDGIARSLKAGGFKTIVFIGDHGGSQPVQKAVAEKLTAAWAKDGVRVAHADAYYDDKAQIKRLQTEGQSLAAIGQHASVIDTSELLSVNAKGVDLGRYRKLTLEATGVSGDPTTATAERGASLLDMRVKAASDQIKALLATH
jgi:creatinine amidohydrolase/Fe(II)-dependent formamide hydrolase-like protein